MTSPAENEMTDSQKIDLTMRRVDWLCEQLISLLNSAQSNPMMRMMMNKATKGAQSNG